MNFRLFLFGAKKMLGSSVLIQPFHILTVTLLSLLLPLSFLFMSRLSCALLSSTPYPAPPSSSSSNYNFVLSLFLSAKPTLLHLIVSVVCVSTLVHSFTGKPAGDTRRTSRLYVAWITLCTLQICVGLGTEATLAAGIGGACFSNDMGLTLVSRMVFFLGLHETMVHWWRKAVKPVVDDTVFGGPTEERWVHRVAMALSCGALWWWRLRDEVAVLVVAAEMKRSTGGVVGVVDFLGWWLYYLTVTVGMVRLVKGVLWVVMDLVCKRVRVSVRGNTIIIDEVSDGEEYCEDKV